MAKAKKEETQQEEIQKSNPNINDIDWTDYVLGLLSDDEKIAGNPTTDGLRRVFELALNCRVVASTTNVVQSPDPNNEKRATVVHSITFVLNEKHGDSNELNQITVDGAADVYWGNCDKIYRNHPVAVAETRAEGRALRRALRLRKVVAAEELAKDIEDNPDNDSVSKISTNQINFIDVLAKRLDINVGKLLDKMQIKHTRIYDISHDDGVNIIRELSTYQTNIGSISEEIKTYDSEWK